MVRQAHPGSGAPAYHSEEQKRRDAEEYACEHGISWTVLHDDLEGTVHERFGGLADPVFVLDADGRVVYRAAAPNIPALHRALEALLAQGGVGPIRQRMPHRPQVGPFVLAGWPALVRGRPESLRELLAVAPPIPPLLWIGYRLRRLLAPIGLRSTPLPWPARAGLLLAGVGLAVLAIRGRRSA